MCRVDREPGRVKMDCLECIVPRYRNRARVGSCLFNPHIFGERIFRVFLEKAKVKWKTDLSFLECLKEDNT